MWHSTTPWFTASAVLLLASWPLSSLSVRTVGHLFHELFPPAGLLAAALLLAGMLPIAWAARRSGSGPGEAATRGALLAGALYAVALGPLLSVQALAPFVEAVDPEAAAGTLTRDVVQSSVQHTLGIDGLAPALAVGLGALVAWGAAASRRMGGVAGPARPSGVVLVLAGLFVMGHRLFIAEALSTFFVGVGVGLLPALTGLASVAVGLAWLRRPRSGADSATGTLDAVLAALFAYGASGVPGGLAVGLVVVPQLGLLEDPAPTGEMHAITRSWGDMSMVNDLMMVVLMVASASVWTLARGGVVLVGRWRGVAVTPLAPPPPR